MTRFQVLNWFVAEHGFRRYLEIGVANPRACFDRVQAPFRTGVDPFHGRHAPPRHYRLHSDDFFASTDLEFDIVFIDGLHTCDQVLRDVQHSLERLSSGGIIVLHDCMPRREEQAREPRTAPGPWYGTVWRAFARLRATRPDLDMRCVDTDCGLGVIRRGTQVPYGGPFGTFSEFARNAEAILRPLPPTALPAHFGRGNAVGAGAPSTGGTRGAS